MSPIVIYGLALVACASMVAVAAPDGQRVVLLLQVGLAVPALAAAAVLLTQSDLGAVLAGTVLTIAAGWRSRALRCSWLAVFCTIVLALAVWIGLVFGIVFWQCSTGCFS